MKKCILLIAVILVLFVLIPAPACSSRISASKYFQTGTSLMNQQKYEDAIAAFTKAIEIDPNYAEAYANRGSTYMHQGQFGLAIADLNKAIELSKDSSLTQFASEVLKEINNISPTAVVIQPTTISSTGGGNQSPYEGNYSGLFCYMYRESRIVADTANPEGEWKEEWSEWKTVSFTLKIKLKVLWDGAAAAALLQTYTPTYVEVTSVSCTDPDFGTGLGWITPQEGGGNLPSDLPTRPLHFSTGGDGIYIKFPNGTELLTCPDALGEDELSVTSNAMILSNSLNPNYKDNTWFAHKPSGIFSYPSYIDPNHFWHVQYEVKFTSWTLTKSNLGP
jgi:hypothetical protein